MRLLIRVKYITYSGVPKLTQKKQPFLDTAVHVRFIVNRVPNMSDNKINAKMLITEIL